MSRTSNVRVAAGVAAGLACCGLLAVALPAAWADHGRGSVRAADRREPDRREPDRRAVVVAPPPREPVRVEAPARRDWDDRDEETRHGGGYARGAVERAVRGLHVRELPHHVVIPFNRHDYFYDDDGNCYEQQGAEYVVVQPPVGLVVAALPPGVLAVVAGRRRTTTWTASSTCRRATSSRS